jgi:signal transduction histidine kinase
LGPEIVDARVLDRTGKVLLRAVPAGSAIPAGFDRRGFRYGALQGPAPPWPYPIFMLSAPVASFDGTRRLGILQIVVRADVWAAGLRQALVRKPLDDLRVTLTGPDGYRLPVLPAAAGTAVEGAAADASEARTRLSFSSVNARTGGNVDVSVDRRSLTVPVSALVSTFLLTGGGLTVLTTLLLFPSWQFLLKPLAELQNAARRISQGDFSVRVGCRSDDEVGQLGEAFNVMAEAVEERTRSLAHKERLAVLGEIAAGIAHDLNNPLAAISMFTQMMLDGLDPSSPFHSHAAVVHRNTMSCKRTIRSLLDMAATSSPEVQDLDVRDVVDDVVELLHPVAGKVKTALLVDAEADDGRIQASGLQLRQALINLVMNAIQATDRTPGGEVLVGTLERGDDLVIRVRDNGPGIPEELRGHVFEPFFTTKPAGQGTGLGLPTARRIAEAHGGRLILCDASGTGTTFEMVISRRKEKDDVR